MSNPRYLCEDPWGSWADVWGRGSTLSSWSASIPCCCGGCGWDLRPGRNPSGSHILSCYDVKPPEAGGLGSVRFMLDSVIPEFQPRRFYESTSRNHLNLLCAQTKMNLVAGLGATLRANCSGVQRPPRQWKSISEGPPEHRHLPFQILRQWHIFQLLFSVNSHLITLVIYNSSVNSCFWICAMAQRAVTRCSLARVCASSISGCCLATAGNGEFSQWSLKLYTEI